MPITYPVLQPQSGSPWLQMTIVEISEASIFQLALCMQGLPCQCVVTVLTTVSSSAHESYASTTLEADAYDYILSLWEETFLSYGCPRHSLSVQYFPIHVKVLGGVGFHLLLSDTASKAIKNDILASTTNDVTYVRQVCFMCPARLGCFLSCRW